MNLNPEPQLLKNPDVTKGLFFILRPRVAKTKSHYQFSEAETESLIWKQRFNIKASLSWLKWSTANKNDKSTKVKVEQIKKLFEVRWTDVKQSLEVAKYQWNEGHISDKCWLKM